MLTYHITVIALLFTCSVKGQHFDSTDVSNLFESSSVQMPFILVVSEGGCYSKREISVTVTKTGGKLFHQIKTLKWNSDDKKRHKIYPKRIATKAEINLIIKIENELLAIKKSQDSIGLISYECEGQLYHHASLRRGKETLNIVDAACEINGLERLEKTFGIKSE